MGEVLLARLVGVVVQLGRERRGLLRGEPEMAQDGAVALRTAGGQYLGRRRLEQELGSGGGVLVEPETAADEREALLGAAADRRVSANRTWPASRSTPT